MQYLSYFVLWLLILGGAPLALGIINKVKAFFAGRRGVRLFQCWYDIIKLWSKESIYSSTSSGWVKLSTLGGLTATLAVSLLIPWTLTPSPLGFAGDVVLLVYLLGLIRVLTVLGALDTGSSFGGMGAARELQLGVWCEGTLWLVFVYLILGNNSLELARMLRAPGDLTIAVAPACLAWFLVILVEGCRVPVDDPETHLELTMIHEAMVLDHGGPDLALVHYQTALKLVLLEVIGVMAILPEKMLSGWGGIVTVLLGVIVLNIVIGVVESVMARHRMVKLPRLLTVGFCLAVCAIILHLALEA